MIPHQLPISHSLHQLQLQPQPFHPHQSQHLSSHQPQQLNLHQPQQIPNHPQPHHIPHQPQPQQFNPHQLQPQLQSLPPPHQQGAHTHPPDPTAPHHPVHPLNQPNHHSALDQTPFNPSQLQAHHPTNSQAPLSPHHSPFKEPQPLPVPTFPPIKHSQPTFSRLTQNPNLNEIDHGNSQDLHKFGENDSKNKPLLIRKLLGHIVTFTQLIEWKNI